MLALVVILQYFFAAVFLSSGIGKIKNFQQHIKEIQGISPIKLNKTNLTIVALLNILLEVTVGLLLFTGYLILQSLLLSILLLTLYTAIIGRAIYDNKSITCSCYGIVGNSMLSSNLIYRNIIFISIILLVYLSYIYLDFYEKSPTISIENALLIMTTIPLVLIYLILTILLNIRELYTLK